MGMFDIVVLEEGVEVPEWPHSKPPSELEWQTNGIGQNAMTKFKVTAEGQLLRKEVERQKLTYKERQEKADKYGYDSWSELVTSEDIDELTVEDSWWVNHNFHGEFQFTANHPEELTDDGLEGVQNVYRAEFEKGELVEIEFVERRRFY